MTDPPSCEVGYVTRRDHAFPGLRAEEWLHQAALVIRAHIPIQIVSDTIQPFPSFSGIYDAAIMTLRMQIMDRPRPVRPSTHKWQVSRREEKR